MIVAKAILDCRVFGKKDLDNRSEPTTGKSCHKSEKTSQVITGRALSLDYTSTKNWMIGFGSFLRIKCDERVEANGSTHASLSFKCGHHLSSEFCCER
jgi:hypothetical protein